MPSTGTSPRPQVDRVDGSRPEDCAGLLGESQVVAHGPVLDQQAVRHPEDVDVGPRERLSTRLNGAELGQEPPGLAALDIQCTAT